MTETTGYISPRFSGGCPSQQPPNVVVPLVRAQPPDARPKPARERANPARDGRYEALMGAQQWRTLPADIRRRFSKRPHPDEATVYRGEVVETTMTAAGWLMAQIARPFGGALPTTPNATGPAVVAVTDAPAINGMIWSRQYPRSATGGRFPQVIHSAKRFAGPTGLEEYLPLAPGVGLLMRLTLHAEPGTLIFRSSGYALDLAGRAIALPRWLWPGHCNIRHRTETGDRFSFTLDLSHPLFGHLIRQVAFFEDTDR
jgi:hypothetical protein